MSQRFTLDLFVRRAIDTGMAKIRVSMPARVESFDPDTHRINAKPLLPDVLVDADGKRHVLPLAVVPNIPVQVPRGGGYSQTFPLAVGDKVTLLFSDRSLDAFLAGRHDADPVDPRTHDLNDPVALLGAHDFEDPPPDGAADHMSLGAESSGATEGLRIHFRPERIGLGADAPPYAVALAEKVSDEMDKLRSTIDALVAHYNAHTHTVSVATTCGAGAGTGTGSATAVASGADGTDPLGDVGSTKVKVVG